MSFFDKIKEIVTESDDDEYDDFYEDDKKDKSIGIAPPARDRFSRRDSSDREERFSERPRIKRHDSDKVVNIHTSSATKVTITKPVDYEEATEICEALKNRRIVLVNTTVLELKIAQRLLDFISGSCYALGGELQQIEKGVYLLSPSNVEVTNELKNELSSKALFNWSK